MLHISKSLLELLKLLRAADQRRAQPFYPAQFPRFGFWSHDPVGLDRLFSTFDFHTLERHCFEERRNHLVRFFRHLNRTGLSGFLHARRQVDRISHSGVFHGQVGPDVPHDDDAGVDTDANVEFEIEFLADLLAERSDLVNDCQTSQHRAFRVILVCKWGAEESHDAVTHHAGQCTFIPIDRSDQVFERLLHYLGPVFRVEVLGHGGRTGDIAEED